MYAWKPLHPTRSIRERYAAKISQGGVPDRRHLEQLRLGRSGVAFDLSNKRCRTKRKSANTPGVGRVEVEVEDEIQDQN